MSTIRTDRKPRTRVARLATTPPPDLHSQLEELLDSVWVSEANWRFDDRIDLATRTRRKGR